MLQTQTCERGTLELLRELQHMRELKQFHLAGGTALALYLGHRKSIDLDLFTTQAFDERALEAALCKRMRFQGLFVRSNTLCGVIGGVKVDLITHPYPLISAPYIENGIRLYGIQDITAMKLSVISDNGTRLKDFVDLAYLSTKFSLSEMLGFYEKKFPTHSTLRPLKALTYFEDIQFDEQIELLQGRFDWRDIQHRLFNMQSNTTKRFVLPPIHKASIIEEAELLRSKHYGKEELKKASTPQSLRKRPEGKRHKH